MILFCDLKDQTPEFYFRPDSAFGYLLQCMTIAEALSRHSLLSWTNVSRFAYKSIPSTDQKRCRDRRFLLHAPEEPTIVSAPKITQLRRWIANFSPAFLSSLGTVAEQACFVPVGPNEEKTGVKGPIITKLAPQVFAATRFASFPDHHLLTSNALLADTTHGGSL